MLYVASEHISLLMVSSFIVVRTSQNGDLKITTKSKSIITNKTCKLITTTLSNAVL